MSGFLLRGVTGRWVLAALLGSVWVWLGLHLRGLSVTPAIWNLPFPLDRMQYLTSPTEAALGIGAAYLALDRFRFQTRLTGLIGSIQAATASRKTIESVLVDDGVLTKDELNILTVWSLLELTPPPVDRAGKKPTVRRRLAYWTANALIRYGVDRLLVIPLTLLVGAWLFSTACIEFASATPSWLSTGFVYFIILNLALTAALPCLVYFASELSFLRLRRLMLYWHENWALNESRLIRTMQLPAVAVDTTIPAAPKPTRNRSTKTARAE